MPNVLVSVILGKISLLTSASNVTLSLLSLPKTILPLNTISPVACKLPVTFVSAYTSNDPVGRISKFADDFVKIELSLILVPAVSNVETFIVDAALKYKGKELAVILPSEILIALISA